MSIVLAVLALLVVTATALPLLRSDQWWIRVLDFPRGQITVAGVVLVAVFFYFRDPEQVYQTVILGLLVISVAYQVVKMTPYTRLMPREVLDADPGPGNACVSLLVANVLMDNREAESFLDLVRLYDPDMILTVETDRWWERALRPLEQNYPHTLKNPLENTYGMLVYSRLKIVDPEIRFILKDTVPSMHMQVVLPSGDRVYMHFVHPDPPNPRYAVETTARDAELLIVGREVAQRNRPTIIAGDFNDVAWSRTTSLFQKTSGLLDPRVGRGMYNTFNANNPLMRWPLDHVFHSDHFKLSHMERGPRWGSDHFPVFIRLSLQPTAEFQQPEPDTSPSEARQVDGKIAEAKEESCRQT